MDTRFLGTNVCKVDGKGRVSLPAKFRRVLQAEDADCGPGGAPRLYVMHGDTRSEYVECLTGNAYDELLGRIEAMDEGEREREILELLYYSFCDAITVDDAGRFVLPQGARDKLDLDGEAVFQGKGRRFHILKPSDSQAAKDRLAALLDQAAEGKEFFNPISLANPPKPTPVTDNAE
ncbi:MraZ putative [Jannaschia sp. CCS1]|nr:MraZ putative [Jannaschia sp. CCS1]